MTFVFAAITSFLVTLVGMPIIIRIFNSINLLDKPDRRKIHKVSTPSLGGIPIVFGFTLAIMIFLPFDQLATLKFFLAGIALNLILGVRDDVSSLWAHQKLVIQILSAIMIVHFADIRLMSFCGFLGIHDIPVLFSKVFTGFLLIALTNAYNLIDGIDGLAGSIAVLTLVCLIAIYLPLGETNYIMFSIALLGGVLAFLIYNWHPSRIFMGDTGSMVIGFILSVLVIEMINNGTATEVMPMTSLVSLGIATLIIPIYDTLRVFIMRIWKGHSPFHPDKNHIHHILLKQGFNHSQATIILLFFTISMIGFSYLFQQFGDTFLVISQLIFASLFGIYFDNRLKKFLRLQRKNNRVSGDISLSRTA